MIIYEATKSRFVNDALDRDIAPIILEQFKERTGYSVAQAQIEAWQASLVFMARALRDDSIPADCGIAVEYRLPQSAKMIDVAVTGFDESGRKTAVIVELKQWQRAESSGRDGSVITYLGGGRRETVHPSYQAWSYAALLQGFNTAVYEVRRCARRLGGLCESARRRDARPSLPDRDAIRPSRVRRAVRSRRAALPCGRCVERPVCLHCVERAPAVAAH